MSNIREDVINSFLAAADEDDTVSDSLTAGLRQLLNSTATPSAEQIVALIQEQVTETASRGTS